MQRCGSSERRLEGLLKIHRHHADFHVCHNKNIYDDQLYKHEPHGHCNHFHLHITVTLSSSTGARPGCTSTTSSTSGTVSTTRTQRLQEPWLWWNLLNQLV